MIGILVDVTRCTGCSRCIDACAEANHLGSDMSTPQDVGDGLSARRYASIVYHESRPVRKFCRHCLEPACVSVCPVGAMVKTEAGPVVYNKDVCMGCRYCMMACPYGIPRYEWDSTVPAVQKCNLCAGRLAQGGQPACVETCPEEALLFGERDELLKTAHQRIQAGGSRYLPVVYGEYEAGGTSVLYISDVSLEFLSLSQTPTNQPLPDLSWNWLSKVPGLGLATAGMMTGLFWIIGRRIQAEDQRSARKQQES